MEESRKRRITASAVARTSIVDKVRNRLDTSSPSLEAKLEIVIAPKEGAAGYFDAWLAEGSIWLCASRSPFLDAARVLRCLGYPPESHLEMRHRGARFISLRARLGLAAKLVVEESSHGPVFRLQRNGHQTAVEAAPIDLNEGSATHGAGGQEK